MPHDENSPACFNELASVPTFEKALRPAKELDHPIFKHLQCSANYSFSVSAFGEYRAGSSISSINMDFSALLARQIAATQLLAHGNQATASSLQPPSDVERYASAHFFAKARTLPIMDCRSATDITPLASSKLKQCEALMH